MCAVCSTPPYTTGPLVFRLAGLQIYILEFAAALFRQLAQKMIFLCLWTVAKLHGVYYHAGTDAIDPVELTRRELVDRRRL